MDGSFLVISSLLASHCPGPHIYLHAELCWSVCDVWKLCLLISLSCCCLHRHVQDLLTQSLLTLLSQVKKRRNRTSLCLRHSTKGRLLMTSLLYPKPHTPVPSPKLFLAIRSSRGWKYWHISRWLSGDWKEDHYLLINSLPTGSGDSLVCFLSGVWSQQLSEKSHACYTCCLSLLMNEGLHASCFLFNKRSKFIRNVACSQQHLQHLCQGYCVAPWLLTQYCHLLWREASQLPLPIVVSDR